VPRERAPSIKANASLEYFFFKKKMIYILTYLSIFFNLPNETTQGYFCKKQRLG
jgi:hypothetical protein